MPFVNPILAVFSFVVLWQLDSPVLAWVAHRLVGLVERSVGKEEEEGGRVRLCGDDYSVQSLSLRLPP